MALLNHCINRAVMQTTQKHPSLGLIWLQIQLHRLAYRVKDYRKKKKLFKAHFTSTCSSVILPCIQPYESITRTRCLMEKYRLAHLWLSWRLQQVRKVGNRWCWPQVDRFPKALFRLFSRARHQYTPNDQSYQDDRRDFQHCTTVKQRLSQQIPKHSKNY